MGEGRGRGGEWAENGEGMEMRKMGIHEKIAQKRNRFGIWGRPLGATAPCHTLLESSFRDNISIADSMSLF